MSQKLCDICKENDARIHIEGEGDYCLECHNEKMLQRFRKENTFHYADHMSVIEPTGEMHTFKVEHMILGGIVSWDAWDQDGNYHFRSISNINENGYAVAQRLFQKIVDGVCTKSLHKEQIPASNLAELEDGWYSLRDKGEIRIIEDENRNYNTGFEIDGKIFTPEQLGQLLSSYPGFSLQYQIHDASDPVLKENEYLVPTLITKESLLGDFETAVNIHGEHDFISYKSTLPFDLAFYEIIGRLEVLAKSEKHDVAVETGKCLARRLLELETDDDYFHEPNLERICKTVDPYGVDEELKRIIEEFYEQY